MLEHFEAQSCSSRSASGLLACRRLRCTPRSPLYIAPKATSDRQRLQPIQAHSLQLAPQHTLVSSNLSNRPAPNGVHGSRKKLKVAVDVDEGDGPYCLWTSTSAVTSHMLCCHIPLLSLSTSAVLGRFLHSLNKYCLDTHGLNFDICDYSDYNFHKVASSCWS